jgi:hypothetical protein
MAISSSFYIREAFGVPLVYFIFENKVELAIDAFST